MKKFSFNKDVEFFELEGIKCFGNFANGSFIGVNETGEKLINYIIENNKTPLFLDKESRMVLQALEQGDYFYEIPSEKQLMSSYLHVTNRCNLNCIGCYSLDCTRNCEDELSLDDFKNILNQLKESGVMHITVSGGEPLVRADIVEILKYAKEECEFESIDLITNGTVRNEELFLNIKPYIERIAVSIDGYNQENPTFIRDEGIFDKVVGTIKLIKELGLDVVMLPTLHSKNIDNVTKYDELSKELGVEISFSVMTCSNELEEYMPDDKQLVKLSKCINGTSDYFNMSERSLEEYQVKARKNCGAGTYIISVASNGDIYPCHMMHDSRVKMGNVKETPLKDILNNYKPLPKVEDMENCNGCNYKNVCGGGCRARAFLVKDNFNTSDPYCTMYKSFYKDYVNQLKQMCCGK